MMTKGVRAIRPLSIIVATVGLWMPSHAFAQGYPFSQRAKVEQDIAPHDGERVVRSSRLHAAVPSSAPSFRGIASGIPARIPRRWSRSVETFSSKERPSRQGNIPCG